jgi:hypothetical protein
VPVNAEDVAVTLRAAGIDAVTTTGDSGPVVTLNPGDATTFLDLLTGGGRQGEHHQIIAAFANTCPHYGNDDDESNNEQCRYCGWAGTDDEWPTAEEEHSHNCPWATANRWHRRHHP